MDLENQSSQNVLLVYFEPDEGEIFYDDRKLSDLKPKARKEIRKEIGMLFQASALFDSLTVEENVAFPLNMFTKMTKEEISDTSKFLSKSCKYYQ